MLLAPEERAASCVVLVEDMDFLVRLGEVGAADCGRFDMVEDTL